MSLRSFIYPPVANYFYREYKKDSLNIFREQKSQFRELINTSKETVFGKKWKLGKIANYNEYRNTVPLQHYEDISEYIFRASLREPNVLWPGIPKYFAQTSGTISGKKFIPVTNDSFKSHRIGRLIAMANYSIKYNKLNQMKGPMLFFSACFKNELYGVYKTNLISSIIAQNIPKWLRKFNLPSEASLKIADFSSRMNSIIKEVLNERNNIRGIVTFPPWLIYFLEQLSEQTSLSFEELFPNFSLLVTSGMSFTPYKLKAKLRMGNKFDHLETYPTSEGFIGFTDSLENPGFSLMPSNGIFFEFVKLKNVEDRYAMRFCIEEVEKDEEYAILVSNNSGLMSYLIGDTVKFISLTPPKMIITGRINRTISLMSENVNMNDTDSCIAHMSVETNLNINEYICYGSNSEIDLKPHYKWIIECSNPHHDFSIYSKLLHEKMKKNNALYSSFSNDGLINIPEVILVHPNSFIKYLKSIGKIDFQQKIEHICVDQVKYSSYKHFMQINNLIIN